MKLIKRFIPLLVVCLILTTVIPTQYNFTVYTVEAHSGRTDRNGGHKDNKNVSGLGSYHYHCGGYPAHLHENGVCPYAGGTVASSSNTTTSSVNTSSASAANTVANKESKSINNNKQSVSSSASTATTVKISDTSYDNVAFNASYYASNHADVYKTCGDDAKALYDHFIEHGIYEGRQSSTQFSILVYKENNQDLVDAFGDDLIKYYNHFVEKGSEEGRVSK